MNCNCVVVSGYYYTGSSAVVDLLKEYNGAYEPRAEFRLIKDPYGLIDLRYNLVERWDPLNSDNSIKDFLWLTNHLNAQNSLLSLTYGYGYSSEEVFGKRFMEETVEFVNRITDFKYEGSWFFTQFKQTKAERIKEKALKLCRVNPKHYMFFSNCSANEFDEYASIYLENIFGLNEHKNDSFAIIDQGLPAQNPDYINNFFKNAKMIIVDRDPRDVYVDMLDEGVQLIGDTLKKTHDTSVFIKWYKSYHKNQKNLCDNVIRVNFEDVVLNYKKTVDLIEGFLDLDSKNHIRPNTCLLPEVSKNNIGRYKNILTKKEINELQELKDFFWEN